MKIKADNSQVRESYYDRLAALRIPLLLMTRGSELIAATAAPPPPPTVSSGSSARSQDQLSWWSWTGTLFFILLDCWKILLLKMSVFLMPYVQFKLNCLTSWKWYTSIPAVTAAAASIRFEIWRGRGSEFSIWRLWVLNVQWTEVRVPQDWGYHPRSFYLIYRNLLYLKSHHFENSSHLIFLYIRPPGL